MDDKKFLFAYVTHNGKYKCKAYRLGDKMTSPVQLIITNAQTGKTTSSHCSGEREATKQWKLLSKANLKEHTMKKSMLRQIIKEEIKRVINENSYDEHGIFIKLPVIFRKIGLTLSGNLLAKKGDTFSIRKFILACQSTLPSVDNETAMSHLAPMEDEGWLKKSGSDTMVVNQDILMSDIM